MKQIPTEPYHPNSKEIDIINYKGMEITIFKTSTGYYSLNNYGEPLVDEPFIYKTKELAMEAGQHDIDLLLEE